MALAGGGREVVQPFDLRGVQLDVVGGDVLLDAGAICAGVALACLFVDTAKELLLRGDPGR